jgi:uncharacterized protein (TIGR03000 family)
MSPAKLMRRPLRAAAAFLVVMTGRADAQVLSKWGNPVVSFGQTPYYAHDSGHGNIPGGNGFTPGYGYYPGNNIPGTTYPWLTGPDVPDYHYYPHGLPPVAHAPGSPYASGLPYGAVPEVDPLAAIITLRVPADADIWIADVKTRQQGELRGFVTPPLEKGRIFAYDIHARWKEAGQDVDRTKQVTVRSGDRLTVDFAGDGNRLPPPRKLNVP